MPFYLRKSISAGPFRFNLSNSGIGVSIGVKGFRIGRGPRGHYVHAGRDGIYYRASLGGNRLRDKGQPASLQNLTSDAHQQTYYAENGRVLMIRVSSGDVMAMRDSSVEDLIDDLNAKQAQWPLGITLGLSAMVLGLVLLVANTPWTPLWDGGGYMMFGSAFAWMFGAWLDQSLRRTILLYNLSDDSAEIYERFTDEFDALAACAAKLHIRAGGEINDLRTWKQNAGAAHLISAKPATLEYSLPKIVRSNVSPPVFRLGATVFYLFPDLILVQAGGGFGAVRYGDFEIRWQQSRFIEESRPPTDARVVGETWKHPNKSGGPDRRFRDNRRLPICLYDVMHCSTESGVNEMMQFSQVGVVAQFVAALRRLPARPASASLLSITQSSGLKI